MPMHTVTPASNKLYHNITNTKKSKRHRMLLLYQRKVIPMHNTSYQTFCYRLRIDTFFTQATLKLLFV